MGAGFGIPVVINLEPDGYRAWRCWCGARLDCQAVNGVLTANQNHAILSRELAQRPLKYVLRRRGTASQFRKQKTYSTLAVHMRGIVFRPTACQAHALQDAT